jgi:hypothetical protein
MNWPAVLSGSPSNFLSLVPTRILFYPSVCLMFVLLFCILFKVHSEILATDPEVPSSIPGATRFSEK